jgi:Arc/MetJ-type ribon-helix-helix transcriptional regulator
MTAVFNLSCDTSTPTIVIDAGRGRCESDRLINVDHESDRLTRFDNLKRDNHMAPDNVRLNYTISNTTDTLLANYCEITGRTASDLVRQLVSELLEHDRQLPPPMTLHALMREGEKRDRRTDMWMSARYLAALDEKLDSEGYPSKSGVIAYLLHEFLMTRANHAGEEMVRITTLIDRLTYTKLALVADQRKQRAEELVAELCKEFVNSGGPEA